jgi:predicted TIM-barrel fold metal-dependent hydrolase
VTSVAESAPPAADLGYWLLSSDSHVVEPAGLFTDRITGKFRDDAPRLMMVDGTERWSVQGVPLHISTAAFAPGDRFLPPEQRPVRPASFVEAVDARAYVVDDWLAANEQDGVWGGVVFPSATLVYYGVTSSELLDEILRVYNEWIADFAAHAPDRIKPVGLLNPDDVPAAARMAEKLKAQGFAGLMLPVRVQQGHTYDSPDFEPLWEVIEGLGMPLSMHIAGNRTPGDFLLGNVTRIADQVTIADYYVRASLADFILSGVFERHPDLKVLSVEHEGSWVFHFLQRIDWHYLNNRGLQSRPRFKDGRLPSDYFHQNVAICFTEDPFLVQNRHVVGVDNIAWGSDFPHSESVYSMSHTSLASQFEGVPDDERFKLAVGNTARLYGFQLPPPREPQAR